MIKILIKCPHCLNIHDKYFKCRSKRMYESLKSDIEEQCDRFYQSKNWRKKREEVLKESNYCCEICLSLDRVMLANEVHHIVKIRESWDKRLDTENLIAVCKEHHRAIEGKTREEILKFIDENRG